MVRKKEKIQPVVAKPLNDTTKRNLVTSFVTNDVNENVSNVVTSDNTEYVADNVTEGDRNAIKVSDTSSIIDDVTKNETNNVNIEVTNNDIKDDSNSVDNKVTKDVIKKSTKSMMVTKRISIGKKEIIANFTSTKRLRPNYNLSEDTIEKIERVSNILGYKKAEFVDIYLNGTLTKILKDLEKSNK